MSKKKDKNRKEETSSKKEEKDLQENEVNQSQNDVTDQNKQETQEQMNDGDEDLLKKYNELNDKYLRLSAEYDNYRKRTLKEKMDIIKNGGVDVLKSILPVIDNFERAIKSLDEADDFEALYEGVKLIHKNFIEFLQQRGVVEIDALGQTLDTDLHEAIAQMPTDDKEQKGKIIDVVEKGYMLNEKVIRFAKVVVAQ